MKKFLSISLLVLGLAFFTGCNLFSGNSNTSSNGVGVGNTTNNSGANSNNNPLNEPSATASPTPRDNPTTPQAQGDLIEFQGVVLSFNENGAQVEKAIIRDLGNGEIFMGTGGAENEIINIFFNSDTTFELLTASKSTNRTVRSEGNVNDLGGSTLTIRGEHQEGSFVARSVDIWRFVD
jgi:hypothetical protein